MLYVFGAVGLLAALFLAVRSAKAAERKPLEVSPGIMPKSYKGPFDQQIESAASSYGIPPHVLKAIVRRETNFRPNEVNPGKSFTLDGVTYSAANSTGRSRLRDFILSGGDPASLGLNPSIGLAQVRVGTARKILRSPRLTASALFNPAINLAAAAALLRELFDAGITLDTIDAYNVGQDLQPRNLPYRDAVKGFARQFERDF